MLTSEAEAKFAFLHQSSSQKRVKYQNKANELLLEKYRKSKKEQSVVVRNQLYKQIKGLLSEASSIFPLSPVQKDIYQIDSGTAFVPKGIKKLLLNIKECFVVRPGTLADLQNYVRFAFQNKIKYTIRGAGTWPFGGSIPLNQEVILDLSYLNFFKFEPESRQIIVGPGVIFAEIREYLREKGFSLLQDITNPNSGTVCGWVVTGGLGIGAYKYGHVKKSIKAIYLLRPDGELTILEPSDALFQKIIGSEGQFGIVAGIILQVREHTYISKPYAFSFPDALTVQEFLKLINEWKLSPSSVIYFDPNYISSTYVIEKKQLQHELEEALESADPLRIARIKQDLNLLKNYLDLKHVVVLEFDTKEDYQKSLKYPFFGSYKRYRNINFTPLSGSIAHHLWNHRYQPVEMKSSGPSMLVSETVLPIEKFSQFIDFIQSTITSWIGNPVKTEGHLVNENEILLQTIILADTRTLRHKAYFGLVPFITQVTIFFGGRIYGAGIWNLPFLNSLANGRSPKYLSDMVSLKKKLDPEELINQSKFINTSGRKFLLRLYKKLTPFLLSNGVKLLNTGKNKSQRFGFFAFGRWIWKGSKFLIPRIIPPDLHSPGESILEMIEACAECDSCERVCPTSDVFGLLGLATPITRRKTANRLVNGIRIQREEALGFLVCTRCDNCTRVCPTNIPLTGMFDMVERDTRFQQVLGFTGEEKQEFIERAWEIMKESPLYREHTMAEQKEDRSHLEHGLELIYPKGFSYAQLFIDPETCIRCGMCAHENACTYGARHGIPRTIPELINENCSLCNACINYCPQNKAIQLERLFTDKLIQNAVDLEEKKYWENQKKFLRDTTTIQRSPDLTDMADIYVTEDVLMEIDKEASTGQIPVSGMGQGDRHMSIGFGAERFSHFHIVGPAQNRLHEGDPDEELSVNLGKRHRYCKFDHEGNLHNPPYPNVKLKSPILFNKITLDSNGRVELAFIKVAEQQHSLVIIDFIRYLEYYEFFREEGNYQNLPRVIVPHVDKDMIDHLQVHPRVSRSLLTDLWQMPLFEVNYHEEMARTINYIRDSVSSLNGKLPLVCGYLQVSEHDIIGGLEILPGIQQKVEDFLACGIDVLHIKGLRNKDNYFVTSQAVRAVHHYLLRSGRRHEVSIIASGGIRLASDSQKTVQRGAEATLIDFAALLALDPHTYKAVVEDKTTTEKLMNLDIDWAIRRLNNQMESRKVQILEVLGSAGFKDLKKTVGEEGRLIDFYQLERRIQKDIFENEDNLITYQRLNEELIESEGTFPKVPQKFTDLKKRIKQLKSPHNFYHLDETNQTVYNRDHVWPGILIETIGKMSSGDPSMFYLKNVNSTGLLGDGFDVMKILYQRDPDMISEVELDEVQTVIPLDKDVLLNAPWMLGGKSVGSIGLDTWLAHVIAARELGIQYDTGEGGYPTSFFLNRKGEPIFFTEPEIQTIKSFFKHNTHYQINEIKRILEEKGITRISHPELFKKLAQYPDLQSFLFYVVVDKKDEEFVSTELKTGLFGVTKETIKKAKRIVIAYSQGAKMGIGGHILSQKVNKLVSYLRGIQGIEYLDNSKIQALLQKIERIEKDTDHPLYHITKSASPHLLEARDEQQIFPELKNCLWQIQQQAYQLRLEEKIDPIEFDRLIRLCEEVIGYSYTSIISPFPFHNCYSIEDVKAFIDIVRMINPAAVICVKVSPSVDIEFIATGLGRIAKDNTEEILKEKGNELPENTLRLSEMLSQYAKKHGMKIEVWLDGPRGGTGASPNIIKGQMGMHIEYAIPIIHNRLVKDGLRNYVKFFVSGGIRTYEDVIKAVALGADGVIWGTTPLVAIGCDRNRNCHDGCSRGIATSNLIMQKLRDVNLNAEQMINVFLIMQMQIIRVLAGLGFKDIRELRGRFDKIQWIGLKERVDFRIRQHREYLQRTKYFQHEPVHATGQSNCGVAAVLGSSPVPSYILDHTLASMKNRGMDGVGISKTLCFPDHPHHYAYRIMVKGRLQLEIEEELKNQGVKLNEEDLKHVARMKLLEYRLKLIKKLHTVFLEPYFDFAGAKSIRRLRETYKKHDDGTECDYREFGNLETDPGDIFRFFVKVKPDILQQFIENEILSLPRYTYIREYFPEVTRQNYQNHVDFMKKAEDLFVFNHSVMVTQLLYVVDPEPGEWQGFIEKYKLFNVPFNLFRLQNPLSEQNLDEYGEAYLNLLKEYAQKFVYIQQKDKYIPRVRKIAAVMSCGKNFAVWKTAGRQIPWDTPDAPNNIIHVRLATGSVVEQMNAHPFAKLHTALTHNGETTNYETLKQRVEQFGLPPLATTDTEVASLKFHLVAEELEYPDWALFESFSPTTGDDLALVPPEIRHHLEEVQRVEFTSSPDGPYQYLCLRHRPEKNLTERVDLKDPADLRPSTTAIWIDKKNGKNRVFSIIASEEQAIQEMLRLMDKEGLIDGSLPDEVFVSNGMISRFQFGRKGDFEKYEIIDRYGQTITFPLYGEHYSYQRNKLQTPSESENLLDKINEFVEDLKNENIAMVTDWIKSNLALWDFHTFRWSLNHIVTTVLDKQPDSIPKVIEILTYFINHLRLCNSGNMAKSSLVDICRSILYELFDKIHQYDEEKWKLITKKNPAIPLCGSAQSYTLLIDATGFHPEGTDELSCLSSLLAKSYDLGWRRFIIYRVNGQRLISTAVMGSTDTDDVEIDVYGTPGEYFGAFMQGGTIRLHGNAQNFAAMGMHHGELYIYGNAGKVCGYASKGGEVYILGDIVDRAWTNSVNDPRCQDMRVHILGSASKYAGESLMGGDFFFGGLYFDSKGDLRIQERPYRGTKLLGGASRGNMLFFDPYDRLITVQYNHGKLKVPTANEWIYWKEMVEKTLLFAGVTLQLIDGVSSFIADGKTFTLEPQNFKLIVPKGGLKGYESH